MTRQPHCRAEFHPGIESRDRNTCSWACVFTATATRWQQLSVQGWRDGWVSEMCIRTHLSSEKCEYMPAEVGVPTRKTGEHWKI